MTAHGRGRPTLFDEPTQATYLQLVADGVRLAEAAEKIGIDRRTVNHAAARDPHFAEQLKRAKDFGRKARIPHGTPDGYDNWNCRCDPCTDAATHARTGRRERARDEGGEVVPLPQPAGPAHSFPLAAVS